MPPEYRDPTDPAEWLRRARSNLARARADRGLPDVLYEDLCFDAQQAVEKSLKAILVYRQVAFPKTHAIADLLTLVHQSGVEVPEQIRQAGALTEYAVEARYPGLFEDVMQEDYVEAIDLAERVMRWAESLISGRSG
ncbi:MAG TPA: HEPN domain-containing protein [Candidatus Acidoferrum sp.]|nr:HEPN domain-containing protein [Candidatus Acidoferrum sp.]